MSSPKLNALPSNRNPVSQIVSWLWPVVWTTIQPGISLIILPNARTTLRNLLTEFNRFMDQLYLLVLNSGGMDAACASAFCTASKEVVLKRVMSETLEAEKTNVFLPVSLARRWGLEEGDEFRTYQVCSIPDVIDHWNLDSFYGVKSAPNGLWLRLKHAPGFWLGQALIFALLLAIFGWQAVWSVLGLLLIDSLLPATIWDVLRLSGSVTSLIVGLVLATLAAFGLPALSLLSNTMFLRWSVAGFTAFAWMGLVFQGLKKG